MHERQLMRWLAAERADRDEDAERMLGELLRSLPDVMVPAGFADRVLIGAGVVLSWRLRAAIAGNLAAAGLAAAFLLPAIVGVVGRVAPGDVLATAAAGFATAVGALDELVTIWRFLAHLRETLWMVVATPPVALTLLAMVVVAAIAWRGLTELLTPPRSPGYA